MGAHFDKSKVMATIAVKDTGKAREFYEGILGFKPAMIDEEAITYSAGSGTGLLIYPSAENAGSSKATSASMRVDNLYETIKDLKEAGVHFEDYDMPELKTEDGVATWKDKEGREMKAAWFRDPDGNILNIMET